MEISKKENLLKKESNNDQDFTQPKWYILIIQIIRLLTLCFPFVALMFITILSLIILTLSLLGIIHPASNLISLLLLWCLRHIGFLFRRCTNHLFPNETRLMSVFDKISTKNNH